MPPSKMKKTADFDWQKNLRDVLIEISTFFINLPADQIDNQIRVAQKRICELLDLDRSTLWQTHESMAGTLFLTHFYHPLESSPVPELMNASEFFPWTLSKIMRGQTYVLPKVTDLPVEAAKDLENFQSYNTKSSVLIPLSIGGGPVFGLLSFAVTREERNWTDEVVKGFELIAQIFANALSRKQAEEAFRENQESLSLATDAAGIAFWKMDANTGSVMVTKKTRELFYFSSEEQINYQSFMKIIHPDDREKVHEAVQKALEGRGQFSAQYRIICSKGSVRWIFSRGKSFFESTDKQFHLMGISFDITELKRVEDQLKEKLCEVEQLKKELEKENIYLREEIQLQEIHDEIVSRSHAMQNVLSQIEQVAKMETTVLIQGETGVGKELIARAIHRLSKRKDRPLVTVNCASLPPTLMESELFGREKGAYTGAMTRMAGRFEVADGATLFLDEIGEIPQELQAKLLRVLEEGKFERLGSTKTITVNVRIIAATNRDLTKEMETGTFRKDLYYRLNVFPIIIPPLRERQDDIPPLVWFFVRQYEKKMGKRIDHIPRQIMQDLKHYPWPGNTRELRNIIEYAMIITTGKTLEVRVPRIKMSSENSEILTLKDCERKHILDVLFKTGWRITGNTGAAKILGMKRTTLHSKMKKLGIYRPNK